MIGINNFSLNFIILKKKNSLRTILFIYFLNKNFFFNFLILNQLKPFKSIWIFFFSQKKKKLKTLKITKSNKSIHFLSQI